MIEFQSLAVFFTASLLLAVAPGPDNIFVLAQSALNGRAAGVRVTLGLCTGLVVHTTAVALGVAAVFHTSAVAFTALKLVGAGYLLVLAVQAFRASGGAGKAGPVPRLGPWQLYRRGIIMNVTNPKVSIFFLAFLPQFTDPAGGALVMQMVLLGAVFVVATLIVFGSISLLSGALGETLAGSPKARRILNRIAGSVFALLALRLATVQR